MAYRFSNTDKWDDHWFVKLKPNSKLLFNFLCDKCDIAGFIEINENIWAAQMGLTTALVQGALKGLGRGLIYSDTGDCLFVKNFLKHQKNLPLNPRNKAHLGILNRFDLYKPKFTKVDFDLILEGVSKGLESPSGIGIGNGNGNGEVQGEVPEKIPEVKTWQNDLNTYLEDCKQAYKVYMEDKELMETQARFHPGVDLKLSLEKGYKNFWHTEAGWKHKKKSRVKDINWTNTITNSIGQNKVYLPRTKVS